MLLVEALELFDRIRSPHYEHLYRVIDHFAVIKAGLRKETLSMDEEISARVKRISDASESWMYYYDIVEIAQEAIQEADKRLISRKTAIPEVTRQNLAAQQNNPRIISP